MTNRLIKSLIHVAWSGVNVMLGIRTVGLLGMSIEKNVLIGEATRLSLMPAPSGLDDIFDISKFNLIFLSLKLLKLQ